MLFDLAVKNRKYALKNNFHFLPESNKIPITIEVDQYTNYLGRPKFSEFWSYRSIRNLQIATDCSVFDRFCFRVLFAYFDESMAYIA